MINWKARMKNPVFWLQIFLSIAAPIGIYFNITGEDITSWGKLLEVIVDAGGNPFLLFTIGLSVWASINNPLTKGFISDKKEDLNKDAPE